MLTDRASLVREFYRLTNTDANDTDLTEHDDSALEGVYQLLQQGADDAQQFLIDQGMQGLWAKDSAALSFTDPGDGTGQYVAMPSDFLRLISDENRSGLRKTNGYTWGAEIRYEDRFRFRGNFFYLRGDPTVEGGVRLHLTPTAAPPSGLVAEYIGQVATLVDGTDVDFPAPMRGLIAAFAAQRAAHMSWFPGDGQAIQLIDRYLKHEKMQAVRRARLSGTPKKATTRPIMGDHWFI